MSAPKTPQVAGSPADDSGQASGPVSASAAEATPTDSAPPPRTVAHLPIGAFAMVMGTGGLATAWDSAARLWDLSVWISRAWAVLALALFVVLAASYLTKAIRHPHAVAAEWRNPAQSPFIATFSVALLVLASAFLPWLPGLAAVLWWTGAVAQAVITLGVVRSWIGTSTLTLVHVHPAWFIPAVGNIIAPIAGATIAPPVVSWYFFGVGAVYWLALLPVVLTRLFTGGTLPPPLVPTLAVLVAPPSVAALAWTSLGGSWDSALVRVLLAVVVFQVLLLAVQFPLLRSAPFAITSWAYTFPLGAATRALLGSSLGDGFDYRWFAAGLLGVTTLLVLALAARTGRNAVRGTLFRPAG